MKFQKSTPSAFQNFLLAKYERFTGQVINQSSPYFLLIDPSSVCQVRYLFCPTGIENNAKKKGRPLYLLILDREEEFVSFCAQNYENIFNGDCEQPAGGERKANLVDRFVKIFRRV